MPFKIFVSRVTERETRSWFHPCSQVYKTVDLINPQAEFRSSLFLLYGLRKIGIPSIKVVTYMKSKLHPLLVDFLGFLKTNQALILPIVSGQYIGDTSLTKSLESRG